MLSTRVYCFLDIDHPAVAWAVMRGMLVSADCASVPPNPGFASFMLAGIVDSLNNRRIYNEFLIESVRLKSFSEKISRLRGMFFFRSRDDAKARIGDPCWPEYFLENNLFELELYYNAPFSDVDANWITHAPRKDGLIDLDDLEWVGRYWRGECFNSQPVWERIATGIALVLDENVRRKCYTDLRERFPRSHIPILMARLASEAGTLGGMISPYLSSEDGENFRLDYLGSDKEFHDVKVIEKMARHPDFPFLARKICENESWPMPDFRPWGKNFYLKKEVIPGLDWVQIPSLHRSRS